jgi:hypothetical protein
MNAGTDLYLYVGKCLRKSLIHLGEKPTPRSLVLKAFAGLPAQVVNDKGRYRQDSETGAPRIFQAVSLATDILSGHSGQAVLDC